MKPAVKLLAILALAIAITAAVDLLWPQTPPAATSPTGQASQVNLTLYFIDVGQGDATLIIAKNTTAAYAMLVDAGDASHAKNTTTFVAARAPPGLDLALATHPDADHIAGFRTILPAIFTRAYASNGDGKDTATYKDIQTILANQSTPKITLSRGDNLTLVTGAYAEVLWPAADYATDDYNSRSVVLRVTLGQFCALLTGDADEAAEKQMLANNLQPCAVLKAGHHGSKYSTTTPFLAALRPELAVISVGRGNRYGHPNNETLARLAAIGAQVLRTDESGTITLTTNGTGYAIETAG